MKWHIGDVTITRFIEIETYGGKEYILPQATPEALRKLAWLCPHFADAEGRIRMSIHSFLVETPTRRIIVDTGMGNDKQNRGQPSWNARKGPYLEQLAAAGCPPDTIDTVLCTHLHVDHVGWNTVLSDGRWIPTFRNARYLMGRVEFDYWKDVRDPALAQIFDDSVRPVADAGLVDVRRLRVTPTGNRHDRAKRFSRCGHDPVAASLWTRALCPGAGGTSIPRRPLVAAWTRRATSKPNAPEATHTLARITPGKPAPAMGPGTADTSGIDAPDRRVGWGGHGRL
jgi:hypothetical protein